MKKEYEIKRGDLVVLKKPKRPHHRSEIFRVVGFFKNTMRSGRLYPVAQLESINRYKKMEKWSPLVPTWNLAKVPSVLHALASQSK